MVSTNSNAIRAAVHTQYVGQSGRPITTRHREHTRYIRNNSSTSAYATHILDNRHEFGPAEETLKLLKPCLNAAGWIVGNHYSYTYITGTTN